MEVKFIVQGFEVAQETRPPENSPLKNSGCHVGIHVILSSMYNVLQQRTLARSVNQHRTGVLLLANQISKFS